MTSNPLNIPDIYNGRENLATAKWIAARIQKHGFCRVGEWLQSTSLIDLTSVRVCITMLKDGDGATMMGESKDGSKLKGRRLSLGKNGETSDFAQQSMLQAIIISEMLSIGEGLPTIFDDPLRSTMAVALLQIYTQFEGAARPHEGDMKLEYDKLSMDPDFILTDWNKLMKFDPNDEDQRKCMEHLQKTIEDARSAREYILENMQVKSKSKGYEEPKVDRTEVDQDPQIQVNDLAARLRNILKKD